MVDEYGEVLRLDLGSGELTCVRRVDSVLNPWAGQRGWTTASRASDGTLVQRGTMVVSTWLLPDDSAKPVLQLARGWTYPGPPGSVWTATTDAQGEASQVALQTLAGGNPIVTVTLEPGSAVLGHTGGRLIIYRAGRTSLLQPDGTKTLLWVGDEGELLALGQNHAVGLRGRHGGSPILVETELATAKTREARPGPADLMDPHFIPSVGLSPDGSLLAFAVTLRESVEEPRVLDLRDGEVTVIGHGASEWTNDPFVWSADSRWLCWVDASGGIGLWSADEGTTTTVGEGEIPVILDIFEMP